MKPFPARHPLFKGNTPSPPFSVGAVGRAAGWSGAGLLCSRPSIQDALAPAQRSQPFGPKDHQQSTDHQLASAGPAYLKALLANFVLSFKNDARVKPAFTEQLVCARHCSKHFTSISSFNPHNNPKKEMGKLRHGAVEGLLKATQFVSGTAGLPAQAPSPHCARGLWAQQEKGPAVTRPAVGALFQQRSGEPSPPGWGPWETPGLLLSSPHVPAGTTEARMAKDCRRGVKEIECGRFSTSHTL